MTPKNGGPVPAVAVYGQKRQYHLSGCLYHYALEPFINEVGNAEYDAIDQMKGTGSGLCFRPCLSPGTTWRPSQKAQRAYRHLGDGIHELRSGANDFLAVARYGTVANIPESSDFTKRPVMKSGILSVDHNPTPAVSPMTRYKWPRISKTKGTSCRDFHERFRKLARGQTEAEELLVHGRISSFRTAGTKLAFVDIRQDNVKLQIVCNYVNLEKKGVTLERFESFVGDLKRGNIVSITGLPHRTNRNELSILISELPLLLASCTASLPTDLKNEESRMRLRHVDLLIRPRAAQILKLRADIRDFLQQYLKNDGHLEVKTPILADAAGGAVARPFYTSVKGFEGRKIALRIAPELWLKRLILGGFERIYEIGPSFRNEGIDLTHNPEFETCEFYRTYTNLEDLIKMTEDMFYRMSTELNVIEYVEFMAPFRRVDFVPAIESELKCVLPDLSGSDTDAATVLIQLMEDNRIAIPERPTLPRLLDKLCSECLEPQCETPTWIINPPECLSPLSKSFLHPNGQMVAARAELFVHKKELVNTYEEENSPIEQRKKFIQQLTYNHAEDIEEKLDESYLEALEYGMPPTGGWGCGIDRLAMLFGGTKRIADTLAFGTLKNVVSLGRHERKGEQDKEVFEEATGKPLQDSDGPIKADESQQSENEAGLHESGSGSDSSDSDGGVLLPSCS